jgi:hypothetical protein
MGMREAHAVFSFGEDGVIHFKNIGDWRDNTWILKKNIKRFSTIIPSGVPESG